MLASGDLPVAALHGLNLLGHAVCGTLTGVLAARWAGRSWLAAPLLAALFVAFPFAFDVVSWPCAFAYPLTVALTLGALLTYLHARERGSRWQVLPVAALVALAGFSYEAGVVAGLVMLMAEVLLVRRPFSYWPALPLAASVIPFLFIIRFASAPTQFLTGLHPAYNFVIALQSLTFPVAPLATLAGRIGLNPILAMIAVGAATLLALGYSAYRAGRPGWFWFGLGWALLWDVIPLLTLPFNWFRDPPRVLYPSAVGVAVMWGAAFLGPPRRRLRSWSYVLLLALCVGLLLPALSFVRGRAEIYRRAGDLLWDVIAAADDGAPTLFVNLPGRITPKERAYPLGHEGVIPLPPPTGADLLVKTHTGRAGAAFARDAGEILPELPYDIEPVGPPLGPNDLRVAGRVFIVESRADGMRLEQPGEIRPPGQADTAQARFGEQILLLSASCERLGEQQVALTTRWQAMAPVEGTLTVFAHLWGADGPLLAQADGDALGGLYPVAWWQPGEVIHDVRRFDAASDGGVIVTLGVWDPVAGERLPAATADGQPLPDDAFPCVVHDRAVPP